MRGYRVAVGTNPTPLLDPDEALSAVFSLATSAAASVDLGGPNVASGQGFELEPGSAVPAQLAPGDPLYAVAPSGSITVSVLVSDEQTAQG